MAISSPPRPSEQAQPPRQRLLVTALVISLAAVVALAVTVVALVAGGRTTINSGLRGSGIPATQSRTLPAFTGVNLAGSNQVTVTVGGRQSVVVHADNNLIGRVTTQVRAGSLIVATTGSFTTRSPMHVDVTVPSLSALTLSGSGEISVTGVRAQRLAVNLPGSGLLTANGTVANLTVTLGGSGMARLTGLIARDVRAVVSGSGLILVTATRSLDATVSGSGAITYHGNPAQVTRNVTGSGAVMAG